LKLGQLQIWKHKTNDNISLLINEQINDKYKVRISGPLRNMHLIEIVSGDYIRTHYKYIQTLEKPKKIKSRGAKK
jgi:hypothetical protein